ncbi:outer membrane lipoprotein carrier protein LolA [Lutibacter sp. HS1-25]|uniref:LolA family protein n=1 Tax=Lutibacter sp. HS1-25 TaxID=2485000 RepID=UPI001010B16E|nr:outer membrane lipoprotein carrier protein LolA [Lutibacter sp. HS1-25]RXP55762.1 outer membrane lipoprotein carrier protein LolA [Lutibacter sp. HS1-25]
MKKLLVLAIITFVNLTVYSQSDAKKLLDEVAAKVEAYKNIEIEFNHRLDNSDADVHQQTRGNVTLQGDLYHLNYMGTEQIFDGKKVYLIIHEDEEVIIQSPSSTEETLTPSKMFSFYKNGYTYKMGALETVKGIKIQYVKLIPIDTHSEIESVKVGIDVKSKHIYTIIETGKNKTVTTLEVQSFKTNQPISPKLFVFDVQKYKTQKKYTISEPK